MIGAIEGLPSIPYRVRERMFALLADFRYAFRTLVRAPYVSIIAMLSIGLGVGAATAVASWMESLVLRPFPAARDQGRLVGIEVGEPNGGMGAWSYQTFKEMRGGLASITDLAAWNISRVSVRLPNEDGSTPLLATNISAGYLDALGVRPVLGRAITNDDVERAAPVALLGWRYWMDRFNGDPSVLGKSLTLNGVPVDVIGVLPREFAGVYTGVVPQFYVPLTLQPRLTGVNLLDDRTIRRWLLFARLAPGATLEQAQAETNALAKRIAASHGDRPAPGAEVMYLRIQFLGRTLSPFFAAMLGVTLLLLAVAAANVASLLFVRASARRQEMAVRVALGATRRRIAQVMIAESALIALAGSAIGVGVAYLGRGVLYYLVPRGAFPITLPITMDWRVLGAVCATAALVTIGCALAPARASVRVAPQSALGSGARAIARGGTRMRAAIVGAQLALCTIFLVLAGMFARGLRSTSAIDRGFSDPEHVLLVSTNLSAARFSDSAGETAIGRVLAAVRALPGVTTASVATMVPLGFGGVDVAPLRAEGYAPRADEDMTAERSFITPQYAATMRIRIVQGRELTVDDRAGAASVALVNETLAKRYFNGDALGKRLDVGRGWATIVGVLHDGKYSTLDEKPIPLVYLPLAQWYQPSVVVHVRTTGDPMLLAEAVRRSLQFVHADLPALQPRTLAEHVGAATFVPRTGTELIGAMALAALALSVVGLYGALAAAVALRSRELAMRMALGASARSVIWLVARSALAITVAGSMAGGVIAFGAGMVLRAELPSVSAPSPLVLVGAVALLAGAAALATWAPARRAVRLSPAVVLREGP